MSESALYPAVKRFLAARGWEVKGEVRGCDVGGARGGEAGPSLCIVELKLSISLELLLQGVDRMACADEVWLAVPATRRGRDRDGRLRKLCRRLGLGLLAVHGPRQDVEVLAEPGPYRPRADGKRRRAIASEHAGRLGDPSPGGTRGIPIVTMYRQEALACASRLRDGARTTRELAGASPRATAILYRNVYGWFERVGRGTYRLTEGGEAALRQFSAW